MNSDSLQAASAQIASRLNDAGYTALWAGGCVRDLILGRTPKDFDLVTNARPEEVLRLFPGSTTVGKAFGVILVQAEGTTHEVATFRSDGPYLDGRHPAHVTFSSPEEDAARRDFTMNGMFMNPKSKEILDFVGGKKDISDRIIRCIGEPDRRFSEDYLRMLRAVRFAGVLEFTIEPETMSAIRRHADRIQSISAERIAAELSRILLEAPRPGSTLTLLRESKLFEHIFPELISMAGQAQPPEFHPEGDVWTHTTMMLDRMAYRDPLLAWSVLLHDAGKPFTAGCKTMPDGTRRLTFHSHDKVGSEIAEKVLTRLRMPTNLISGVSSCVRDHMKFMHIREMKKSTLRRFMGKPTFRAEEELHRLDCLCSNGKMENIEYLKAARTALDESAEKILPEPWISGHFFIQNGVPPGPGLGKWMELAYDAQLEGRFANPDQLKGWILGEIQKDRA